MLNGLQVRATRYTVSRALHQGCYSEDSSGNTGSRWVG
jgi:hypothetical protein